MSRILGIDYGEKRIGLALNSESLALPYQVIPNDQNVFPELQKIIRDEEVERIVIGWPLNLKGSETAKTQEVAGFISKLQTRIKLPIIKVDERFTTRMLDRDLEDKDKHAAAEILQSYLDQIKNQI